MINIKSVVITGVSSGIGHATTAYLIEKGFHVFGSVRSKKAADNLSTRFGNAYTPLIFDITDEQAGKAAAEKVKTLIGDKNLAGLVNNAGISVPGPLMHIPLDDVRYQMEVNFIGQLRTIQLFLPLLGTDPHRQGAPGRIVSISSVSGRRSYPFLGPYAASKHALEAMSAALRVELLLYGIDVIVIEPGNVHTPIWDKIPDMSKYKNTDYFTVISRIMTKIRQAKNNSLSDTLIAHTIHTALTSSRPKTRYLIVKNKLINWTLIGLLPDRLMDRFYLAQFKNAVR